MITQPLMKDGSTGIKNSPTAMAAMVNDVIEKSDVLKNALGDTRADGEDPSSLRQIGQVLDRYSFQIPRSELPEEIPEDSKPERF